MRSQEAALTESKALLFRMDAFDIFKRTQINRPSSVVDNIGSSTFGNAISAAALRVLQGALLTMQIITQSLFAVHHFVGRRNLRIT
jgi:hypothetical protein